MRLFMRQTNVFQTSPVRNRFPPRELLTELIITVKVFTAADVLVPDSEKVLQHIEDGVYRETMPVLASLVDNTEYNLEIDVKSGTATIWYFYGPIKAIVRRSL